jgi:hypothetical protein
LQQVRPFAIALTTKEDSRHTIRPAGTEHNKMKTNKNNKNQQSVTRWLVLILKKFTLWPKLTKTGIKVE